MAFEKIENADLIGKMIAELADVPELTADELKKRFDAASKDVIIPKFNKLIDALAAVSAASNIGMNPPEGITAEQNIAAVIAALAVSVKSNSESSHTHSNKAVIDAITADAKKKYDDLVSLFSAIKTISNVVKDDSTLLPTGKAIVDYVEELGGGDMLKVTYDSDNDGVVDNASKLGGQSPTYYQKASDDTLNTQNKTVVGAVNEVQEMMEALTEKMDADKIIIGTFAIDFNGGIGYLPYNHYPEYEKEPICIAMIVGTQRYGMTVVPSNYKDGRIELYTDAAINGNLYVSYFIGLRK